MSIDKRKELILREIVDIENQLKTHRENIKILKARMSILDSDDIVGIVKMQDQMDIVYKMKDKSSTDFYFLHSQLKELDS